MTVEFRPAPKPEPRRKTGPPNRVKPAVRLAVFARDGRCVATRPEMKFPHQCATQFGRQHSPTALHFMELEHVQDGGTGSMSLRATSDLEHLVTLCGFAASANGSGWNLANKHKLRDYIAKANRRRNRAYVAPPADL